MRIYHSRLPGKNFGDDLNMWMWPRLFPEHEWSDDAAEVLVGIGTILTKPLDDVPGHKLVFGSGMWLPSTLPRLDASIELRFVRGPISAWYLPEGTRYITDGAAALRFLDLPEVKQTDAVGFMPHQHLANAIDCEQLCRSVGMTYLDPRAPVEELLKSIRSCDRVITEAMHGAIVADLYRIPWCRISIMCPYVDGPTAHSLKWLDWGMPLQVDVSAVENYHLPVRPRRLLARPPYWAEHFARRKRLARGLADLKTTGYFRLSSDRVNDRLLETLREEVERLRVELTDKKSVEMV
jgi:succinoglycan biosynthesis protein ExoV